MILSRYAERSEAFRVLLQGFTLPEVCVAFTVLGVGTTALLSGWNFFNREVADERCRVERFYEAFSAMEKLIESKPLCTDSLIQGSVSVQLERLPGNVHLAWAVVQNEGVSLKRLVRCK